MRWFKEDFFTWVDSKPCTRCGGASRNVGSQTPTADDRAHGAGRVEGHQCTKCNTIMRFPRYNCPKRLLDTREGRCGEWANCFTALCRALGYEARYIHDQTDHVWSEVYSPTLDRWVHLDPCENAWDRPLIYEQGWGKKLSYILAFSKDQVVDVTFRYTIAHEEVCTRRTLCKESWLANYIATKNRSYTHSSVRKAELQRRAVRELVEFWSPAGGPSPAELIGRISGSAEWRESRSEGGPGTSAPSANVIKCTAEEMFELIYDPINDVYCITNDGVVNKLQGWQSGVYSSDNIFRKVEYDWNVVYLARENSAPARLEWRISCNKPVEKVELVSLGTVFQSGQIKWACSGVDEDNSFRSEKSLDETSEAYVTSRLRGNNVIRIVCELSAGDGDCAWQHTQLFRLDRGNTTDRPFCLKLFYDK